MHHLRHTLSWDDAAMAAGNDAKRKVSVFIWP